MHAAVAPLWVCALLAACAARADAAGAECAQPPTHWVWQGGDPRKPKFRKVLLIVDRPQLDTPLPLNTLEKYRAHFWDLVYIVPGQGVEAPWERPPEEQLEEKVVAARGQQRPKTGTKAKSKPRPSAAAEDEDGGRRLNDVSRLRAARLPYYGCNQYVPKTGPRLKDTYAYMCIWMVMRAALGGPVPPDLANFRPSLDKARDLEGFMYVRADVWITPGMSRFMQKLNAPVFGEQGGSPFSPCLPLDPGNKKFATVAAAYDAMELAKPEELHGALRTSFVCNMWAEMFFVPKAMAMMFGAYAKFFNEQQVITRIAIPTIFAGMAGVRQRSGQQIPNATVVQCFDSLGAPADDNAFNAWSCGHKLDLEDPCHRRFIREVWTGSAGQTSMAQVAQSVPEVLPCKGRGGFYLEIDHVLQISGTLGHPHVHRVELLFKSGAVKAYGGRGGDSVGPWTLKEDEYIASVRQCESGVGTLGRALDFITSKGRIIQVGEPGLRNDCKTSSLFRAPEGQQIVGLQFTGSKLNDVLTPTYTARALYNPPSEEGTLMEVLKEFMYPMRAGVLAATFLIGSLGTVLVARLFRLAESKEARYVQVAAAESVWEDDEAEVYGKPSTSRSSKW